MSPEKSRYLYETYALLFPDRDDFHKSLMGFGFSCRDGWFDILDSLFARLYARYDDALRFQRACGQQLADFQPAGAAISPADAEKVARWRDSLDQANTEVKAALADLPVVVQVKEKFGQLRVYIKGSTEQQAVVDMACDMSVRICEVCGNKGYLCFENWVQTLCVTHMDEAFGSGYSSNMAEQLAANSIARELLGMASEE